MELYGHTCCCCKCEGCETEDTKESLEGIIKIRPEITYNTNRFHPNGKKAPNGIEIRFGMTRPTAEVRDMLKAHGFKFSEKQTIWYAIDNTKSRELADFLTANEIEADDTQYEKRSFWAKIHSKDFFDKLSNYTEFMVAGQPPQFFRTKKQLLSKVSNPIGLAMSGALKFKKFYNKVVGEDGEEGEPEENEEENEDELEEETENEDDGEDEEPAAPKPGSANMDLANKLKDLAFGMQKQIDSKINSATSKQRTTAKRLRVAEGMRQEGYALRNIQTLLLALSEAYKTGIISNYPLLKGIKNRANAELLNRFHDEHGKEHDDDYLQRVFNSKRFDFAKIGIDNLYVWAKAIKEKIELIRHVSHVSPDAFPKFNASAEKIQELEMKVKSMKIPGFFPTPKDLIDELIMQSGLSGGDKVLEPSAGKGDILDRVKEKFSTARLYACELNPTLREMLKLKGYNVVGSDFLDYDEDTFDIIIMNPPFENKQDIDHVNHALTLLKPGGRLAAIISEGPFFRDHKKDKAFRAMLRERRAYISEPIKGAFKNSFNPTSFNVRIVAINESPQMPDDDDELYLEEMDDEQRELYELDAKEELEALKRKVKRLRKQRGMDGLEGINNQKLQQLERWAEKIDLPALWDFK